MIFMHKFVGLALFFLLTGCFKSAEVRQAESRFRNQCIPEAQRIFPVQMIDSRRTVSIQPPRLANCSHISTAPAKRICEFGNQELMINYERRKTKVVGAVYDANQRSREDWLDRCVEQKMRQN